MFFVTHNSNKDFLYPEMPSKDGSLFRQVVYLSTGHLIGHKSYLIFKLCIGHNIYHWNTWDYLDYFEKGFCVSLNFLAWISNDD